MFSCSVIKDLFFWEKTLSGDLMSVSYDYKNRQRRQDIPDKFVENGSFYLSKPDVLRKYNNRLGGRIGMTIMDLWKMFEIDSIEDLRICESLMKTFLLGPTKKKR
jgi:N-acylneuraminate cytidylyltransferase